MTPGRHLVGPAGPANRSRQSGIVMWVALIVLIVMTLAGLAMLRQMGGGVSVAGNIAFKENATSVADSGTEAARQWLATNPPLEADIPASGYYASWGASVDPATFPWGTGVPVALDAGTGNAVLYLIHRLCEIVGPIDAPAQRCSDIQDDAGGSKEGLSYGVAAPPPQYTPFYRVTVQVRGPRNTLSFTQVVLR